MSAQDRRSVNRCPMCQGPAVEDKGKTDGIRCRNSTCRQNHLDIECPRCKAKDLAHVSFKNNEWNFTCADCENAWSAKKD